MPPGSRRVQLGLVLLASAGVVGGIAWITEALINALALWVVAAFLGWTSVMAFLGRTGAARQPSPAEPAESPGPDDYLVAGEIAKDFRMFLRRLLAIVLILLVVPLTVVLAIWGVTMLGDGMPLGGGAALLVAGGLAWCCWGRPLRRLWGAGGPG